MDDAKQQLIEKLKSANNILVTVSHDPSIDQLASCIGLTLLLNKQGKHAAAVFSGKVPSILEFLQPGETIEKNTDSLRDFIISLDKAKADKLRYKVEEDVVRIFITPYKTSLSQDDLEFSEGDFNVDVVVALGVKQQEDLDQAITTHGRILHDATVASINTAADGGLGTINWHDPQASSLSELVTDVSQALGDNLLDEQIATALLTGIVSETGRFSNDRTSSQTMSSSALLLSAGANQQLVASKLESPSSDAGAPVAGSDEAADSPDSGNENGVLEIDHAAEADENPAATPDPQPLAPAPELTPPLPEPSPQPAPPAQPAPPIPEPAAPASNLTQGAKLITEPPTLGGTLTANSQTQEFDPVTDPLSLPSSDQPQLLDRAPAPTPPSVGQSADSLHVAPSPPSWTPPPAPVASTPPASLPGGKDVDDVTLTDLEKSVGSVHASPVDLKDVRDEVSQALSGSESHEPIEALNAQPLGNDLHPSAPASAAPDEPKAAPGPDDIVTPTSSDQPNDDNDDNDSSAPPPVPPPIPFQFGNPPPPK